MVNSVGHFHSLICGFVFVICLMFMFGLCWIGVLFLWLFVVFQVVVV